MKERNGTQKFEEGCEDRVVPTGSDSGENPSGEDSDTDVRVTEVNTRRAGFESVRKGPGLVTS